MSSNFTANIMATSALGQASYISNISNISSGAPVAGVPGTVYGAATTYATPIAPTPSIVIGHAGTDYVMTIRDKNNKDLVSLTNSGEVIWNDDIDITEAISAFSSVIKISAEKHAGITGGVKSRMRDSVFEDLIEIASKKGPLSADELTYLLDASKIVEKLKGSGE